MSKKNQYIWKFQRLGGVDQAVFESEKALEHLSELDPKLWIALSCPTLGLNFDTRTLELIDKDKDGRIRIADVKEAVTWICDRLESSTSMIKSPSELPLHAISTKTEDGKRLKETAEAILSILEKKEAISITQEDITPAASMVAASDFNGDGILPPLDSLDLDIRQYIQDAMACMGGVKDASGKAGIDAKVSSAFIEALKNWKEWSQDVTGAAGPLGKDTPLAWDLLQQLKEKIDDYFLRCDLAAFAPQAAEQLNPDKDRLVSPEQNLLSSDLLKELPLSTIHAFLPLRLESGINPMWYDSLERFLLLVEPLLDEVKALDAKNWKRLQEQFAPYSTVLSHKPSPEKVGMDFEPTSSIEKLGIDRINEILESNIASRFKELSDKDAKVPAAAADIADVERLVLYHHHLYRLVRNFVNFVDFYSLQEPAMFQAGTLYIDGRSCQLCLTVNDIGKHAEMATLGNMFLIYCECRRVDNSLPNNPEEKINIAAAITAGEADLLLNGRNGMFINNKGHIYDATVVRVLSSSINLRQAIWDPYRRFIRLIEEQVNKFAGSKQDDLLSQAEQKINSTITTPEAAAKESTFDMSKNVGIFAAVGIALGAIGTAIGSIANALFSLSWWQYPLVALGLFIIISGPSVIMAWINLRKRSLGTILEASGWALNNRLPISIPLANELTFTAELPSNSTRSYVDPFRKKSNWPLWTLLAVLFVSISCGWLLYTGHAPFNLSEKFKKIFTHTIVSTQQVNTPSANATKTPAPQK